MTSLPASQAWLYVRNNSSFLVKRNGVQFSREPGNLTQLNTYKSSGLCNDKAIDINLDEDGKIVMALKAPKRATKPSKSLNKTPLRKNFRRSAKAIQSQTAGKFYRGDLTGKALARYAPAALSPTGAAGGADAYPGAYVVDGGPYDFFAADCVANPALRDVHHEGDPTCPHRESAIVGARAAFGRDAEAHAIEAVIRTLHALR